LKGIAKQATIQFGFDVLGSIIEAGVKPGEAACNRIVNTSVRARDLDALNHAMRLMRDHWIRLGCLPSGRFSSCTREIKNFKTH
jgi:hypothetical protein